MSSASISRSVDAYLQRYGPGRRAAALRLADQVGDAEAARRIGVWKETIKQWRSDAGARSRSFP